METLKCLDVDPRLQLPNHAVFVGMSMSGKTRLVLRILQETHRFNPKPLSVIFYYDQFQDVYADIQEELRLNGVDLELRHGCHVDLSQLEKKDEQTLVIIDDATESTASSADIAKICTNGRHKNVSLWLIWHTLYSKHASSRLIVQNISYFFFLPSVRLTSQLQTLDSQLRMKGKIVSAYKDATERRCDSHRYLLLDLSPNAHPDLRLRSQIHEDAQVVYL